MTCCLLQTFRAFLWKPMLPNSLKALELTCFFSLFVDAVLNMRGTNPVTVQDVKSQLRIMKRMIKESVKGLHGDVSQMFVKQTAHIERVRRLVMGDEDAAADIHDDVES